VVNLGICAKCPKCAKVDPSITDKETDKLLALPSIRCDMIDDLVLLADSVLPENCIFVLEQKVTQPDTEKLIQVTEEVIQQDRRKSC
jgi:hypothetical protein